MAPSSSPILPGSTIGVLGGGQLGRMFAMAARRLGYRVHTLSPDDDTPTGQIADLEVQASYDDVERIAAFAQQVDVVTFEFENVPAAAAQAAEAHAIVRPNGRALAIAQHRIREKTFLADRGLPVPSFAGVTTERELLDGLARVGVPAVLKTASLGYDGKGQVLIGAGGAGEAAEAGGAGRVEVEARARAAWQSIGSGEAILEAFVDLALEVSVIGARGTDGSWSHFGPIENAHHHHILDVSLVPAAVPEWLAAQAVDATRAVMEGLDYVGVLCVEFFVTRDGRLLVNEIAPRTHNSGHLTIDACRTSQFEQQLRAICGLPLGAPDLLQPAAMTNLLGDLWSDGEPDWAAALTVPDVKLHLYGKTAARPGRKMGHLTALAPTADEARSRVLLARERLGR